MAITEPECECEPTIRYIYVNTSSDYMLDPETEKAMREEIEMLKRQLRAVQQEVFSLRRQRKF